MHISSGRWVYGFLLTLLTALLWGILPIKLKQVLQVMDPITVTWFRLIVAGSCLFVYLALTPLVTFVAVALAAWLWPDRSTPWVILARWW
ncbi:hypothetical protein TU82_01905 [Pseudomonas orientalis]|nr:hypothetical protein TU82_01905 [Pseudomonas orientalis]